MVVVVVVGLVVNSVNINFRPYRSTSWMWRRPIAKDRSVACLSRAAYTNGGTGILTGVGPRDHKYWNGGPDLHT